MTKRIALFLPSLEGGGAERAFVDMANHFISRGVAVDMAVARYHGPFTRELHPRVRVIDFSSERWLRVLWRLVRYLRQERPDALMAGLDVANMVGVVASLLAGPRASCVISQRAMVRETWQLDRPRTWRAWLKLIRLTYPRARLAICNSGAAAAELVQDFGVHPDRCTVVYNPVDVARIERLASEPVEDEWLAPGQPPLLLAVGSLRAVKDNETMIRAFAHLRRARPCNLMILGEGEERAKLEQLVRELGLEESIRMPGFRTNPFPWIAGADVLLSASLTEGCPNVIQQALACGTPVVATNCPGGTSEVLEGGKWGRLVPVQDPEAMANAVLETLDDPSPPDGRIRARDFDTRRITEEYLQLLLPGLPVEALPVLSLGGNTPPAGTRRVGP